MSTTAINSTQVVHLNSFLCLDNYNETTISRTCGNSETRLNTNNTVSKREEENEGLSKLSGNEAASKLWDLIQSSSSNFTPHETQPQPISSFSTPSRYTEAQRNHTLYHHTLKQPSSKDEINFLAKNQKTKNVSSPSSSGGLESDAEAELKARLSTALLGAQKHSSTAFSITTPQQQTSGHAPTSSFLPTLDNNNMDICDEYFVGEGQCIETIEESFSMKAFSSDNNNNGPSPTSTLCFPESSSSNSNYYNLTKLSQPEINCHFISEESPNDHYYTEEQRQTYQKHQPLQKSSTEVSSPPPTSELESYAPSHRFVVCADPQLGMTTLNREWVDEIEYCKKAVKKINSLQPRPKFVCICGDMVDMEESLYNRSSGALAKWDKDSCDRVKEQQVQDVKNIFNEIHPDIALICVCGNHDIGNRPTPETISQFQKDFGDEYLAFWTNGTYNIILNNVLFNNPDGAMDIFEDQLKWLEDRLKYANKFHAAQIFVYAHHPWFLYHEDEEDPELKGGIPVPSEWIENEGYDELKNMVMSDAYFHVPKIQRKIALDLFRQYNVTACFCGHYHQNVVKKTSWGMDLIITGPIGMLLESTSNKDATEKGRGIRIVDVTLDKERKVGGGYFSHHFENF